MAIVLPTAGQLNWDAPLNLAVSQLGGNPAPDDQGYNTWTYDPVNAGTTTTAVSGTLYLCRMPVRQGVTLSRLDWVTSGTIASGVVAGQNFVGIYSPAGVRLAQLGVDVAITTTGLKQSALTPFAAPTPFVWAFFLFNATTPPSLVRATTLTATPNMGLPVSTARVCINGTGRTSAPANITPASNVLAGGITATAGLAA